MDYLTTYGPGRAAFVVRHALKAAKAADFPMQTFGGTKHFLPQALAAWERGAEVEEAKREADARTNERRRREEEDRERRRRLADRRGSLSDEALAALKRRAEEALAADGVDRTRLGYDVLVKLKVDEFLEREYMPTAGGNDQTPAERAAMECCEVEIVPGNGGGHIAR